MKLTTHLHLVQRLRISGAMLVLPLYAYNFMACTETKLCCHYHDAGSKSLFLTSQSSVSCPCPYMGMGNALCIVFIFYFIFRLFFTSRPLSMGCDKADGRQTLRKLYANNYKISNPPPRKLPSPIEQAHYSSDGGISDSCQNDATCSIHVSR